MMEPHRGDNEGENGEPAYLKTGERLESCGDACFSSLISKKSNFRAPRRQCVLHIQKHDHIF